MRNIAYPVIFVFVFLVSTAFAGEKEKFSEYYYSAKNVITDLNTVAVDINDAKPSKGISPVSAEPLIKKLSKAREGLESILAYSDSAIEINEGYILYIDKMIVVLGVSENYYETKDRNTRTELINALDDAEKQKSITDALWKSNLKKYGLE